MAAPSPDVVARLVEPLRALLRGLYRILPKAEHAVVYGWPDYEDNALALEAALQDTRVKRVVLLVGDPRAEPPVALGSRTLRVRKDSLKGWLWFLTARYAFFTHRCFMRSFPPNVVSVNVWHGMPIKRIGWLLDDDPAVAARYTLATSPFWAEIVDAAMRPWERVLTTGLPRNDRLFADRDVAWRALGLAGRPDLDRLVTWLPTYRRSARGYQSVDGRPTDTPFELDGVEPEALNALLAELRMFAVVKPHPMAGFTGEERWSNLLVLDSGQLAAKRLSLHDLLAGSDALISDVSSVTVDFLLLDRPVIHAAADLAEYGATRGYTVEDLDQVLAGPVVTSYGALADALRCLAAGEDPEAARRRRVRELSHSHLDGSATSRLLEEIGLLGSGAGAQ